MVHLLSFLLKATSNSSTSRIMHYWPSAWPSHSKQSYLAEPRRRNLCANVPNPKGVSARKPSWQGAGLLSNGVAPPKAKNAKWNWGMHQWRPSSCPLLAISGRIFCPSSTLRSTRFSRSVFRTICLFSPSTESPIKILWTLSSPASQIKTSKTRVPSFYTSYWNKSRVSSKLPTRMSD